jgi:hypothetical protein
VYVQVLIDLRLGFQKPTTTEGIDAEDEDDKPLPVAAATANVDAASLAELAGEDGTAMSLHLKGWMSSKWGMGDLELAMRESLLYTVEKF